MDIISRSEAAKKFLNFYYTGKPCKKGHLSKRSVSTGACAQCNADYQKRYRRGAKITQAGLKEITVLIDPRDRERILKMAESGIMAYQYADGTLPSLTRPTPAGFPEPPKPPEDWLKSDPK
jgi:hypothetical protein